MSHHHKSTVATRYAEFRQAIEPELEKAKNDDWANVASSMLSRDGYGKTERGRKMREINRAVNKV
jgi:hypothetical protein